MFALVNHAPIVFLVGDIQLDILTYCIVLIETRTSFNSCTHCSKESNHESFRFGIEVYGNRNTSKLFVTIISVLDKCDLVIVVGAITFSSQLFFQRLDMTLIPRRFNAVSYTHLTLPTSDLV